VTENRTPLDQVLDLFVYAPLGLALTAREELPKLAERGRTELDTQLTMARVVGQFAVAEGRRQAEKLAERAAERLVGAPPAPPAPPAARSAAARPAAARSAAAQASSPASRPGPARSASAAPSASPSGNGSRPSAQHLAIPGYDTLAASQVVQRLPGLSAGELEAVRAYEEGTRRRRTILTRIEQLQAEA
jgi:hypothetical protein